MTLNVNNANAKDIDVDDELSRIPEEELDEEGEIEPEEELDEADNSDDENSEDATEEDSRYEERYKASTQEALAQRAYNNKIATAHEEAEKIVITDITDEDVEKANPDIEWDMLSDFEKKMLKKDYLNEKKQSIISTAIKSGKEYNQWMETVDTFLEKVEADYPKLSGKEDEFRRFASKESRRGLEFNDLVKIFLFDDAKNVQPKKRGSLMNGKSSPKAPISSNGEITAERMAYLRKKDPKRYKKLIKSGAIKIPSDL